MRMVVSPAKRAGSPRTIFDASLSVCEFDGMDIAISVLAEPNHQKKRYQDRSRYRYDITLSTDEVAELARRIAAA